ncbi:MAG: hybrid sensor histidine kinase/response regulator, partial [Planctomycetota bacterium]
AMGQLAGGIAHDFNNILQGILGYGELARGRSSDPTQQRYLDGLQRAAERARDMVQRILAFSRRSERSVDRLELQAVVAEALGLIRDGLPATIAMEQRFQAPDAAIEADAAEIHQVVMNLCTNAVHAMQEHGRLTVSVDRVQLHEELPQVQVGNLRRGIWLRLQVTDTGTGMDEATKARLFEPYFTTKPRGEGTGLGMAVVHGLVQSAEGALQVASQVGFGTTVTCWFPEVASLRPSPEEHALELACMDHCHILVVDDEAMLVDLATALLEEVGASVHAFTDARVALAHWRANRELIDLVMTDQTMPHLTGLALAAAIREQDAQVPILLCSGFSRELDSREIQRLGLWYLDKPIERWRLLKTLGEMLAGG